MLRVALFCSHRDLAWALTAHSCSHGLSRHFQTTPPLPNSTPPPPFLLPSQDAAVEGGAAAAATVDIHVEASTCSRATDRATSVSATAILDALSAAASQASAMSFAPLVPRLFRVLHQALLSAASPPVCSEPRPIASVEPSTGEVLQGPRYICIYICMYIYMFT